MIPAEWQHRHIPLYRNFAFTFRNPLGTKALVIRRRTLTAEPDELSPGILARQRLDPMRSGEALPHGMALIALNAALSLLELDGARRDVPVNDRAAVSVEVQPLLTDRRRHENPGPERTVERL